MKAIIDTDPGIDDAMAIFFAASCPEIDLIGLTTVYGNVPVEMSTRNALHLVEMLGRHVPVAQGASSPLKRRPWEPVFWIHGKQGLGALDAPAIKTHAVDHDAADFLVAKAKEQKGQLVVFAIGPLTNIAMAIERDPEFASNVARIVVMGGVVHATGNVTAYAEANIYNDPDAAQIVFDSGAEVTLVGLDVTDRTSMTKPISLNSKDVHRRLAGSLRRFRTSTSMFTSTAERRDAACTIRRQLSRRQDPSCSQFRRAMSMSA